MKVEIVEVGPRDGLQNEAKTLPIKTRVQLVKDLAGAGLRRIEAGAFVSPKWVPQMADSALVMSELLGAQKTDPSLSKARLSALVPNPKGMEDALAAGVREVAIFGACSESFSQKNINCSIESSFERFAEVMALAKRNKIKVRGYLSTAFGCPYEGAVSEAKVVTLVKRMLALGVFEISVGDTIGVATPRQVRSLVAKLIRAVGTKKLALHFHDTRGTALANVLQSLELGIRVFDSSCGGLGGCPYAKGASGNLATEDLVYMLAGMGVLTGVDLQRLMSLRQGLETELSKQLPGRASRAGLPKPGTVKGI